MMFKRKIDKYEDPTVRAINAVASPFVEAGAIVGAIVAVGLMIIVGIVGTIGYFVFR